MTYFEYNRLKKEIKAEHFAGLGLDPYEFGIQKARFEQEKILRLISIVKQTTSAFLPREMAELKLQLEIQNRIEERFHRLKREKDHKEPQIVSV
jgi:hypothetical protein